MVLVTFQAGNFIKQFDIPLQGGGVCKPPNVINPLTGVCGPAPLCNLPELLNPLTGGCEVPSQVCKPPEIFSFLTRRCEAPPGGGCTLPQIYDTITGKCINPPDVRCPTGTVYDIATNTCVPAIKCPPGTQYDSKIVGCVPTSISPPTIAAKTIKIATLKSAFRTQEVPILVTATCTDPPAVINGEDAALIIDGNVVDRKTVIAGTASFSYTFKTAGLHSIRVTIPRSVDCDSDGSTSTQIEISEQIPSTLARLKQEKEAEAAIKAELERVREETRQIAGGF